MSLGVVGDKEKWDNKYLTLLEKDILAKCDASVILEPTLVKGVQAFGWLKQQALLRERKLKPRGTPVKQRLFRHDDLIRLQYNYRNQKSSRAPSMHASCLRHGWLKTSVFTAVPTAYHSIDLADLLTGAAEQ